MSLIKLTNTEKGYRLLLNDHEEWRQLKELKDISEQDVGFLIRTASTKAKTNELKGDSSIEKLVINWCATHDVDYLQFQLDLLTRYNELTRVSPEALEAIDSPIILSPSNEDETIEEEEINIEVGDSLTLNETAIACTVLAAQYPLEDLNCKPNIHILGPSTTSKSTDMAKFKSPDLVNWIGRTTLNAGAPGRPNREAERPVGWYERSNGRCVMINEAGNFVNEMHARKVLGELADLTTTGVLTISDPVEDFEVHSQVTVVIAMTYYMHKMIEKANLGIGPRYMILKTKNNRSGYLNSTYITKATAKPRSWYVNLVRTAAKREIGEPTEDMIKLAHLYTQNIMDMASVKATSEVYKKECIGGGRLGDQLIYMALMRGVLYNRPATVEDVEYFLSLVANVVPNQYKWENLMKLFPYNRPLPYKDVEEKVKLKLSAIGILKQEDHDEVSIDPEWYDFLQIIMKHW